MKDKEILEWAKERGILNPEFVNKQFMKVIEETGELAKSIIKDDKEQQKDDLGDMYITIVILAEQLGHDLDRCIYEAFNTIKNRKGKLVDGSFIKEEDYINCKTIK